MENISLLTYTHSNCFDIHKMYFDSVERYYTNISHYVLCDSIVDDNRVRQIIYNENSSYYEQMLLGLSKLKTNYLIYSQEDYILYDKVNLELLRECMEYLETNKNIMFIRLISSGLNGTELDYDDKFILLNENSEYFFSTQITLWRKDILKKMFELSLVKKVSEEPKNSPYLKSLKGLGLCTKLKGEQIGGHHNSIIYPYTATAVIKGSWNLSQYGNVLEELFGIYHIDKNKRGFI